MTIDDVASDCIKKNGKDQEKIANVIYCGNTEYLTFCPYLNAHKKINLPYNQSFVGCDYVKKKKIHSGN